LKAVFEDMDMKNILFIMLPNPEKMFTDPHRGFLMCSEPQKPPQKQSFFADRYQKVSVSEHSIITVYIYFVIFEVVHRLSERCKATTFTE
jgi:hypothetical protein